MNSKKLGMIAAAALTVVAAQANAEAKKDGKAATKGEEWVCATAGCGGGASCAGKTYDTAKDGPACTAAKGTWMSKADFAAKKAAKGTEAKAHDHTHPAPAKK